MATQDGPPFNTNPMSTEATTIERLTMTDADTIVHEQLYALGFDRRAGGQA